MKPLEKLENGLPLTTDEVKELVALVHAQRAVIAQLEHHSEFAGDYDIVECVAAYNLITDGGQL